MIYWTLWVGGGKKKNTGGWVGGWDVPLSKGREVLSSSSSASICAPREDMITCMVAFRSFPVEGVQTCRAWTSRTWGRARSSARREERLRPLGVKFRRMRQLYIEERVRKRERERKGGRAMSCYLEEKGWF